MLSSRRDFVVLSAAFSVGIFIWMCGICQPLLAQSNSTWKRPEGDAPAWLTADAARWSRLNETRKVLTKKVSYDFKGTPLNEAMVELGRQVGVPIHINAIELDNCGLSPDQPVTASGKELRLCDVKEQILKPLDLNWRIHESDIELSSDDDISSEPVLMVYDLAHKSQESINFDHLIRVVSQTIDCDEWRDFGGTGDSTMLAFGSALVVFAPDDTHGKIVEFLTQLSRVPAGTDWTKPLEHQHVQSSENATEVSTLVRLVRNGEPLRAGRITLPVGRDFTLMKLVESKPDATKVAGRTDEATNSKWSQPTAPTPAWLTAESSSQRQALLKKLSEPISINLVNEPLNEAMAQLTQERGIAFWIDQVELDNVGTTFDAPVSISANKASLSEVLARMLKPLDLTYRIDGQRMEITSSDDAEQTQSTRVYDMAYMSEKPFDISLLADVIAATVDPDVWRDFGGVGDAAIVPSGSQLIISATDTTFNKIDSLMYQLSMLHPNNLPPAKAADSANLIEVSVQSIPGGSTIEIPKEGIYRLRQP